jgi:hypothetical protein
LESLWKQMKHRHSSDVGVRRRHDAYDYTKLYHFFQIIIGVGVLVSMSCPVSVSVLHHVQKLFSAYFSKLSRIAYENSL